MEGEPKAKPRLLGPKLAYPSGVPHSGVRLAGVVNPSFGDPFGCGCPQLERYLSAQERNPRSRFESSDLWTLGVRLVTQSGGLPVRLTGGVFGFVVFPQLLVG